MAKTQRPTAVEFKQVLQSLTPRELNRSQREILRHHYGFPKRKATGKQLAELMDYKTKDGINLQYGLLATALATKLGVKDSTKDSIAVIASFSWPHNECVYTMRPAFAAALKELGWV